MRRARSLNSDSTVCRKVAVLTMAYSIFLTEIFRSTCCRQVFRSSLPVMLVTRLISRQRSSFIAGSGMVEARRTASDRASTLVSLIQWPGISYDSSEYRKPLCGRSNSSGALCRSRRNSISRWAVRREISNSSARWPEFGNFPALIRP